MAIVTGASSGLGAEYARAIVKTRPDIGKIILIARRAERLEALARELGDDRAEAVPLDITNREALDGYSRRVAGEDVALLINCAGFGLLGDFAEFDAARQAAMPELNCSALTYVTALTLPRIREGGAIVNVCSIAAFAPTPRMAVYCATKSYVMAFSRALREELRPRGINVLAACPGPMDTEFMSVAGIPRGKSRAFDLLPRVSARSMAENSLAAARAGKAVYTDRPIYKLYRAAAKILPHSWLVKLTRV